MDKKIKNIFFTAASGQWKVTDAHEHVAEFPLIPVAQLNLKQESFLYTYTELKELLSEMDLIEYEVETKGMSEGRKLTDLGRTEVLRSISTIRERLTETLNRYDEFNVSQDRVLH